MAMKDMEGVVFNLQRFCVHDGPGIRTTVFLKGCPLRCAWCHNPEGFAAEPQLALDAGRCTGCGACLACPQKAYRLAKDGEHWLNRDACKLCGQCVAACPANALEIIGRKMTVQQVMAQVKRDREFYAESGGGLTLSGGEPMMQPAFALALARAADEQGIGVCLETSGQCAKPALLAMLPHTKLFLYDCKLLEEDPHRRYTGAGGRRIVQNLKALDDAGGKVVLRCPLVPGVNDEPAHMQRVAQLANSLRHLVEIHLQPYHPLGADKATRLGTAPFGVQKPIDPGRVQALAATLGGAVAVPVKIN